MSFDLTKLEDGHRAYADLTQDQVRSGFMSALSLFQGTPAEVHAVWEKATAYVHDLCCHEVAVELGQRTADLAGAAYGEGSREYTRALLHLAALEARFWRGEGVLNVAKTLLKPDDLELNAWLWIGEGNQAFREGDMDLARTKIQQAVDVFEKQPTKELTSALGTMASILVEQDATAQEIEVASLRHTLAVEQYWPAGSRQHCIAQMYRAVDLNTLGRKTEAVALAHRTIIGTKKYFGPEYELVGTAYVHLGNITGEKEYHTLAKKILERYRSTNQETLKWL